MSPSAAYTSSRASDMEGVLDLQSEHLRHTRSQIMALVAEIAAAARSEQNRDHFFAFALSRLREAMGGEGAAIWQVDAQENWSTAASLLLPERLLASGEQGSREIKEERDIEKADDIQRRFDSIEQLVCEQAIEEASQEQPTTTSCCGPSMSHAAILDVLQNERQPTLIPPSSIATANGRPPNPLPYCLVYAPISIETDKTTYWIQAVVAPNGGPATHRGYLRFVVQIADLIGDFLRADQLRRLQREKGVFDTAQQVLDDLDRVRKDCAQSGANPRAVATAEEIAVAKSVLNWLDADEAFYVYRNHNESRIRIGAKANDMRLAEQGTACIELKSYLKQLAGSAAASQSLVLNQTNDQERLLHELFGAQAIGWLPIQTNEYTKGAKSEFVAIVLLWYQSDAQIDPSKLVEKLCDIAPVARVATRYASASTVGKIANAMLNVKRRSLIRKLAGNTSVRLFVLVAMFAAVCCIPVPMTLTAPATLVPAQLQTVYAPASGTVDEVMVRYGQAVQADESIMRIKSADIENEHESLLAERIENTQRRDDIQLQLLRSNELTAQQRTSLEGELQTLSAVIRTQDERLALVEKQLASLELKARNKGVVGTWKIDSVLHHKPVLLGQPLAMIYDPEGSWGFEIELAEKDLGAFIANMSSENTPKLRCRLDSAPLDYVDVQVQSDCRQIVLHRDANGAAIAPIYAGVDPKALSQLTPGASGSVELTVGNQPVAWVLTREFVLNAWAKIRLWI